MKMKRFLSLILAMVMSLALAAPAFAAEDGDPNEGIMPLAQIFSDDVNLKNGSDSIPFTTTPGYGTKLHIWFRNQGTETVKITLRDYSTRKDLQSWTFRPYDSNDTVTYTIPTPDKACSYYLNFVSIGDSGARVIGQVAVALY